MRTVGERWRLDHPDWEHECCKFLCDHRKAKDGRDVCGVPEERCPYRVPAQYEIGAAELALRERIRRVLAIPLDEADSIDVQAARLADELIDDMKGGDA